MEEWIRMIDAVRVRVERLAKLALKDKRLDGYTTYHLTTAARELDTAQAKIEAMMSRAARPAQETRVTWTRVGSPDGRQVASGKFAGSKRRRPRQASF